MTALGAMASLACSVNAHAAPPSWSCPDGFQVHAGLNRNFPWAGLSRSFVVYPPEGRSGNAPAPVWAPLTGTVEATQDNLTVPRSGANALLAKQGVMVIGAVRQCADGDASYRGPKCDGPGHDGWTWTPWNEGRVPTAAGDRWKTEAGPDAGFLEAAVRCVGTKWKLDARRLYVGGISSGATMTNRALLFDSDFWAGGVPISGEWYVTLDDGSGLSFNDARAFVASRPEKIFQGRVGPYPLPRRLDPMIVIVVWGGEKDKWDCGPPIGLCSDYRPTTQAASNYYSAQPALVTVTCTVDDGHQWPQVDTQAFNSWALKTLISHPKGTSPAAFRLTPPPPGYDCNLGRFNNHYPSGNQPGESSPSLTASPKPPS